MYCIYVSDESTTGCLIAGKLTVLLLATICLLIVCKGLALTLECACEVEVFTLLLLVGLIAALAVGYGGFSVQKATRTNTVTKRLMFLPRWFATC